MTDIASIESWLDTYVWQPVVEAAKFAVGHEDSPKTPPFVPVIPSYGCGGSVITTDWDINEDAPGLDTAEADAAGPDAAPDLAEEDLHIPPETVDGFDLLEIANDIVESFDLWEAPETTDLPLDQEAEAGCIPEEEIPYDYKPQNCIIDLADVDHDGYCVMSYEILDKELQCSKETGDFGTDCDDNQFFINPSIMELCDGIDNNCNDQIDEVCPSPCIDNDEDGYGENCSLGPDCEDHDPAIHPNAPELCDEIDNNCNNIIDEGCEPACIDNDKDGYGENCEPGPDCDDNDPLISPSMPELCDEIDNNCNTIIDEGCEPACIDDDFDGYGENCILGPDCDDSSLLINPGAGEICNGLDDNCDEVTDENDICLTLYYCNNDEDDFVSQDPGGECNTYMCIPENCQEEPGPDCNDENQNIFPGSPELCNNFDDNCNGIVDEDIPPIETFNGSDWQKYVGICQPQIEKCVNGAFEITQPEILPQEEESCTNEDENCDFIYSQGSDNDGDGFKPQGGACGPIDCNDSSKFMNPGLAEICDAIDNNCDGNIDEGCSDPFYPDPAPFNLESGMLRGVFEGGEPGDSGRTKLGNFDAETGLFHYFIKFYWNLDSGETVYNGQAKSIEDFANEIWDSGRMPLIHIKVDNFKPNSLGLSSQAVDAMREFTYWAANDYDGEMAVVLFPEMNLVASEYCQNFSAQECLDKFHTAYPFLAKMLLAGAPGKIHAGINYNMRFSDGVSIGANYTDWDVGGEYYNFVGFNIFTHACQNETNDNWFLYAALNEEGNHFIDTFCQGEKPCIIAETGASNQCDPNYQNWWLDRLAAGNDPGLPYINIHMPQIKGYVWFNQNNESLGGWEENWQVQDLGHYQSIFGNPYYKNKP